MSEIKDCPFCQLEERVLLENEYAVAFLSNPRKAPGHFLVCPKHHVEKPWELEDQEIGAIFKLVFELQKRLTEQHSQGCDVQQNYRPFIVQNGLKVDHVHYHVLPRDLEDEVYKKVLINEHDLFESLIDEERTKFKKLIIGNG